MMLFLAPLDILTFNSTNLLSDLEKMLYQLSVQKLQIFMYFASSRELQKVLYFGQKCELFSKKGEIKSELFGSGQLAGLLIPSKYR